ncbi:MAG: carbohydrate ABC transporter permease, partial [Pseudonocardia sp.]|nr:carbohydrate ABC transporter permease [Pseudonocardia sp.]
MAATVTTGTAVARRPGRQRPRSRPNWLGGLAGWIWLAVVVVPVYWIIITSFKLQSDYFTSNPLLPPGKPTLANYGLVIASSFPRYFANSVIVTVGAVVPAVLFSFMAAFALVRGSGRFLRSINALFLMGLAIPLQAV